MTASPTAMTSKKRADINQSYTCVKAQNQNHSTEDFYHSWAVLLLTYGSSSILVPTPVDNYIPSNPQILCISQYHGHKNHVHQIKLRLRHFKANNPRLVPKPMPCMWHLLPRVLWKLLPLASWPPAAAPKKWAVTKSYHTAIRLRRMMCCLVSSVLIWMTSMWRKHHVPIKTGLLSSHYSKESYGWQKSS